MPEQLALARGNGFLMLEKKGEWESILFGQKLVVMVA
jgi:hypothetical protein